MKLKPYEKPMQQSQNENPQPDPQSLESLLQNLSLRGWRVHNLYQGKNKWEARIKLDSSTIVYGSGEGPTPNAALTAALEHGEARKNWRPRAAAVSASPTRSQAPTTTDDLMGGLDL
jgi:hypothetical protein